MAYCSYCKRNHPSLTVNRLNICNDCYTVITNDIITRSRIITEAARLYNITPDLSERERYVSVVEQHCETLISYQHYNIPMQIDPNNYLQICRTLRSQAFKPQPQSQSQPQPQPQSQPQPRQSVNNRSMQVNRTANRSTNPSGIQPGKTASGGSGVGLSEFVAVDVETTGLNPSANFIIEIAAVKIKNNVLVDNFCTLINPGVRIPDDITRLTGITDSMVHTAPSISDIFPAFMNYIEDLAIIAHNAQFDMSFLNHAARELGYSINNDVVCTVNMSREVFPQFPNHKLGTVTERLGINLKGHHRALADAMAAAQIYLKCVDKLGNASA